MKFECKCDWNKCTSYGKKMPTWCTCGMPVFDWREIAEPAALPELTVDEPDENRFTLDGIEYEAVDNGNTAVRCENCALYESCKEEIVIAPCRSYGYRFYFRRVKPQSPTWLKVGNYAKRGEVIGKIDWISRDSSEVRLNFGDTQFFKVADCKPVTWLAWDVKMIVPMLPLIVRSKLSSHDYHIVIMAAENCVWLGGAGTGISYADLLKEFEQLSGLPCGVPQVDGADLEG